MTQISVKQKANWYGELRENVTSQILHKPNLLPASIDEAYAIQSQVISNLAREISGWKLGGTNAKTITVFGCDEPYFGPMFVEKFYNYKDEVILNGLLEIKGEAVTVFKATLV